jgi:predicted phosphodiesterase
MEKRYPYVLILLILSLSSIIYSCKKTFEYSPYTGDAAYGSELRTDKNLQEILERVQESGKFKVAFLSDTHYFHDELSNAIDVINSDNDISFVVVCGDLSDQGLEKEYSFFYDQAIKLNKPVLTVIGNHDYLANAENIYGNMFGPANYTLDYHGFRFIFFDNVFWEKNSTPDFDWLNTQASSAVAENKKPVLISHIPFFGDQYDSTSKARHLQILDDNNVSLSVHGHQHTYSYTDLGSDNKCLVVPAIGKRSFCTVSFDAVAANPVVTTVNF